MDKLAKERYDAMIAERIAYQERVFAVAPHTGHRPGHKYSK